MKILKKILLVMFFFSAIFTIAGCSKENKELADVISQAEQELAKVTPTPFESYVLEPEDEKFYLNQELYVSFKNKLKELIDNNKKGEYRKNFKEKIKEVKEIIEKLSTEGGYTFQGKKRDYPISEKGLKDALAHLQNSLKKLVGAENASDVLNSQSFVKTEIKEKAQEIFDKAVKKFESIKSELKNIKDDDIEKEQKLAKVKAEIKTNIDVIKEQIKLLTQNAKPGEKVINGTQIIDKFPGSIKELLNNKLNLGGKTITFYSHAVSEDSPYVKDFRSDFVTKEEYKHFLDELQAKYNFKLEFKNRPGNYFTFAEELKKELEKDETSASIIRVPELSSLNSNIAQGNIMPIDSMLNKLSEEGLTSDYLMNGWQLKRAQVLGKTFGVQRFDGITYPDVMVFNRSLLKEKGITEDMMPDNLWKKGEWTIEKLGKIIDTFNQNNTDTDITAFGLTPKFMGINGVLANGVHLTDQNQAKFEDRLQLTSASVTNITERYSKLYKGKAQKYYIESDDSANLLRDNKPMLANHMRDTFAQGKLGITAIQNWQVKDIGENYQVVPFPQNFKKQDNSKYISPIESGDILATTKGANRHEVSLIMMLINKFMIEKTKEYYALKQAEYKIEGNINEQEVLNRILVEIFVQNKLRYESSMREELMERQREIISFINGYKSKDYPNVAKLELSELAQMNCDQLYSLALQNALRDNKAIVSTLGEYIGNMKAEYDRISNQILRFKTE